MNDEELLRTLGAVGAEEERDPARSRWERLLGGEASPEELAELERLAEGDEEAATLLSAYRPLEASARDRIASHLHDHLQRSERASVGERAPARVRAASRLRSRVYAVSASLALAAAVALLVTRGDGPGSLPLYALDVSGSASSRGPANAGARPGQGCLLRASARGSFELLARSEHPGAGAVVAEAFLVRGGETERWSGALEVSPSGSVRILDSARGLTGASELRVVVGLEPHLSSGEALAKARRGPSSGPGWQVLSCAIAPSSLEGSDAAAD